MTEVTVDIANAAKPATPVAYETAAEVWLNAPPERVWKALTEEVGSWWAHSYREDIVGIYLEPWPGGRFYEKFDEEGNGGLYATVTYAEKPSLIRYQGPMGMAGSQVSTARWELIEQEGGTLLKINGWVMGDIDPELISERREGSSEILTSLKRYIDEGVAVR